MNYDEHIADFLDSANMGDIRAEEPQVIFDMWMHERDRMNRTIGPWQPIPDDMTGFTGKQVLLRGPSGYMSPNHIHIESAHWDHERGAWMTDSNDRFAEAWPDQWTHWAELGEIK